MNTMFNSEVADKKKQAKTTQTTQDSTIQVKNRLLTMMKVAAPTTASNYC